MKRFHFRLDRVSRVRRIERDRAQAEWVRARSAEAAIQTELVGLRQQAAAEAANMGTGTLRSPADIRAAAFRASLRARAAEMATVRLATAAQESAARAADLTAATQRVDALDKLEARHREEWTLDTMRAEAVDLDDIATTRAARRDRAGQR